MGPRRGSASRDAHSRSPDALDASLVIGRPTARRTARLLSAWFASQGRSFAWRIADADPYGVLMAELFLQQTPATRVDAFLPHFLGTFPDLDTLKVRPIRAIADALKALGLQNRRSIVLKNLAKSLAGKDLRRLSLEEWKAQPGVGPYVAAAMRSTLHGDLIPMIDVNTARIFGRYAGARTVVDLRKDKTLRSAAAMVVGSGPPRVINWALMDLGAAICTTRNPKCPVCPLRRDCQRVGLDECPR